MTSEELEKLREFLSISGLSQTVKDILQEANSAKQKPEITLDKIRSLVSNYNPSQADQEALIELLSDSEISHSGEEYSPADFEDEEKFLSVKTPSQLPDPTNIAAIFEPFLVMEIIAPTEYTGKIIELINTSRGECLSINSLSLGQIQIKASLPLGEVIVNFYDELKSATKGYASMSYQISGWRPSSLVKIDILLNGKKVEPLSIIVHKQNTETIGRRVCEKLKELIPRQQVEVAIQAAIGSRVLARETVKPFRKDVTQHMYGGDITRRMKLLDKQKEGKKRMKSFANVNVPNDVFIKMLKA